MDSVRQPGTIHVDGVSRLPVNLSRAELVKLFESNLSNFRACVLAEAIGRSVPQELAELLAEPVWIDHWADALLLWSTHLRLVTARTAYVDPSAAHELRNELKMVRARHGQVCQRRATEARASPPFAPDDLDPAESALLAAHQDKLADLIRQKLVRGGHDPSLAEPPEGELVIPWAYERGLIEGYAQTRRVTELHAMEDGPFLEVVRKDVIEQPPTPELEHPLLLGSWRRALEALRHIVQTALGRGADRKNFEFGKEDLPVKGWDATAAKERFALLGFMVGVHERWCDQRYLTRRFLSDINRELDERVNPLRKAARQELVLLYPNELEALHADLADSSSAPTITSRGTVPLPPGTPINLPPGNRRRNPGPTSR